MPGVKWISGVSSITLKSVSHKGDIQRKELFVIREEESVGGRFEQDDTVKINCDWTEQFRSIQL